MIEYTFTYKIADQLGLNTKRIRARSQSEAKALFDAWVQDQISIGTRILL